MTVNVATDHWSRSQIRILFSFVTTLVRTRRQQTVTL